MRETHFKLSDAGLIPEGWQTISLGEIGEPRMCKRILKGQTLEVGDIPFYKIGTFGYTPDAFISKDIYEDYKHRFHFPKKGDVLISAAGTIGRLVVYDGLDAYYQDSNIVWIENDESKVLNNYLYYALKDTSWDTSQGTISRLYNSSLKAKTIVIPSNIDEQRRIAKTLTDIDDLLDSLSKLIEKKKDIKTATMQLLLTGKQRLAGFIETWEEKEIGDIVNIVKGQSLQSKDFVTGTFPVVAGGKTYAGYHNVPNHINNCITISASGAYAGYVWLHNYPIFASDCSVIEGNEFTDLNFLYNVLKINQGVIYKAQTGGAQPHIHPKDIAPIKVSVPSKEEQTAIATILTDMDNEIYALEAKKAKYESIKKGMMQELLTGHIRLV